MESFILEMKGITKKFPGVVALDHVDLQVRKGTIHALVGENGAGKSTLMKVLNGVYEATEGEIWLDGEKLELHGVKDAQAKGISIIYQEFNLINTLSVAENIFIGRYNGKRTINWKTIRAEAQQLIESLGFSFQADRIVGTLSTAEKQLVEIAKALSLHSKIIVMDEPTSSLTEKDVDMFFPIIQKLKDNGITVIYISHKLDEIYRLCDYVTVMRDGKVTGNSPVKDISRDEIIEKMVGRSLDMEYPPRTATPGEVVMHVENLCRRNELKHISFDLHKSEILGIAGLVGAGRTELAEAIFGADPAESGDIVLHGETITLRSTLDGKKHSIGLVTEDRKETGLVLPMSVMQNITITDLDRVCDGMLLKKNKEKTYADQYVDALKIKTPSIHQTMQNLSGGNQQKVVLAKWLYSDVDILILDEPTRGIDVGAKYDIYCLMNELTAQGKSIIMISSELPEVLGMSDRVLVMHGGQIKGELRGKDMTAEKVMKLAID